MSMASARVLLCLGGFLLGFGLFTWVAWMGGYDFTRGETSGGMWAMFSLMFGGFGVLGGVTLGGILWGEKT